MDRKIKPVEVIDGKPHITLDGQRFIGKPIDYLSDDPCNGCAFLDDTDPSFPPRACLRAPCSDLHGDMDNVIWVAAQ